MYTTRVFAEERCVFGFWYCNIKYLQYIIFSHTALEIAVKSIDDARKRRAMMAR